MIVTNNYIIFVYYPVISSARTNLSAKNMLGKQ